MKCNCSKHELKMKLTRQLTFRSDRQTSDLSNPGGSGNPGNTIEKIMNTIEKTPINKIEAVLSKPELRRHSNDATPIDLDTLIEPLNLHQSHCVSGCLLCNSAGFHESDECIGDHEIREASNTTDS